MPTETDPRLPAPRSVDSPTARTPAVMSPPVVRGYADEFRPTSPALTDDPGEGVEPYPDEWATDRMSPLAQRLHGDCCDWGGDVEGHGGIDYEAEATRVRAQAVGEALDSGELIHPDTVKAPIETKVAVGGWTSLAVGAGLALANLLLARLDLIPSLLGGESPWVGVLVLVLGATLPAAIAHLKMYYAPHSPRPADVAR